MGMILSIVVIVAAAVAVFLVSSRSVKLTWYEWLLGFLGFVLVLLTISNYFGSINEMEPKAASMFLLVLGLPGVILLALPAVLFFRRKSAKAA